VPRLFEPTAPNLAEAAARLRGGGVVVFPTETVYGLGAITFNPHAVGAIYQLKGRPSNNPLIAHVLDAEWARSLTSRWNDRCDALVSRFWPGPLTLVLSKSDEVPMRSTAGLNTIAVRSPAHPAARRLLELTGESISAPSANRSGEVSPTRAEHVMEDFADVRDLIVIDGGPCELGIESTVLDLTVRTPRILRPGTVTAADLRLVLGEVNDPVSREQGISPGTAESHYAPATPAHMVDGEALRERLARSTQNAVALCFDASIARPPHRAIVMSRDPDRYARELYHALRQADDMAAEMILIERPPPGERWNAVHDRLSRATAGQ